MLPKVCLDLVKSMWRYPIRGITESVRDKGPQTGNVSHADRTEGPEKASRCHRCCHHGSEDRNRRNYRDIDAQVQQDQERSCWSEGACRKTDARGAEGDCQKGSRREVGVMSEGKPNYFRAKNSALKLLRERGITEPPVDPAAIAGGLGISVYFVTFDDEDDNISGFYDPDDCAIYVNEKESPVRQNFTIAHELGHHMLHRDWAKTNNYVMLFRDQNAGHDLTEEKEANVFAANLLVPRSILDEHVGRLSEAELGKIFAVSIPVIKHRLKFEYDL